jgi:hypothetical protein
MNDLPNTPNDEDKQNKPVDSSDSEIDWPTSTDDCKKEQKKSYNSGDRENLRLQKLVGEVWIAEKIDVIKWMANLKPPRWVMWLRQ